MKQKNARRPFLALFFASLLACFGAMPVAAARAQGSDPAVWIDFNRVRKAQPALLEKQFARLGQHKRDGDIYVVGLAGWSAQDVFITELDGAIASLGRVLPIDKDHVVRLINNVKTLDTFPVASPDNFKAAIHAVGAAMDKQKDVLILFMTTHGTPNGIVLKLGRAVAELPPKEVAAALNEEQIRNRVVIVSACYSGIYMKPLADENSIVLTAADATHPSFGCSARRRWTYFGDALFNRSLRPGVDLQTAFRRAKALIARWEKAGKLSPSNPQAHFGEALARTLDFSPRGTSSARP